MKRPTSTVLIALILTIAPTLTGCGTPNSSFVTLILDDAAGLEAGAPVLYHGVEAGEVSAVKLIMDERAGGGHAVAMLSIQPEVFAGLYDGMTFRVKRDSWVEGTKRVVIDDRTVSQRAPLAPGAIVVETTLLEHLGNMTTDRGLRLLDDVREVRGELLDETGSALVSFGQWLQSD